MRTDARHRRRRVRLSSRTDFLDGIELARSISSGLLNFADTLLSSYCDNLDLPRGSTYADAAQLLIYLAKRQSQEWAGRTVEPRPCHSNHSPQIADRMLTYR